MTINIISPFALDKKYGVELNRCIKTMPDEDWICVLDWDCMLLSHNQVPMMYSYINKYPDTGLFVALSNRSGSEAQRYGRQIYRIDNMSHWHRQADQMPNTMAVSTPPENKISGFLLLFSKQTWLKCKFSEELDIWDVDRTFAQGFLDLGKPIYIMNDVLVWHSYRLLNGTADKTHLFNETK